MFHPRELAPRIKALTGPSDGKGVLLISGPSGAGKGTVLTSLLEYCEDSVQYSVSATTRAIRANETDGVQYFFVTREDFQSQVDRGEYLEWAEVHGNLYGTLPKSLIAPRETGALTLMEIDTQGVRNIRPHLPHACYVFIYTGLEELERRLIERGSETPETLNRRLETARQELEEAERMYAPHEMLENVRANTPEEGARAMRDAILARLETMAHAWFPDGPFLNSSTSKGNKKRRFP